MSCVQLHSKGVSSDARCWLSNQIPEQTPACCAEADQLLPGCLELLLHI